MKGFDKIDMENFFELDHGVGHSLRPQVEGESEKVSTTVTKVFFSQSKSRQCVEQVTVMFCRSSLHQYIRELTG